MSCEMTPNKSLERTMANRGRTVHAVALLRVPVRNDSRWLAVHLNR